MKKNTTRRSFLKSLGSFLFTLILLPFTRSLTGEGQTQDDSHMREAKYYSRGEDLAG